MIFLVLIGVIALYIGATYNKFVTSRGRIKASVQEIGNQLKRQVELIPNIIDSAKLYLKHEKDIFKDLTDARKSIMEASGSNNVQKMSDASDQLQKVLSQFKVIVEATPQIRGVETINTMMNELRDTADKIMYARRTFIDLTADYNISRVTFPSNLVAMLFKFEELKGLDTAESGAHLEVSAEETKTPKVGI